MRSLTFYYVSYEPYNAQWLNDVYLTNSDSLFIFCKYEGKSILIQSVTIKL